MEQRQLGDSDLYSSAIGFGTWEMSTTMYGAIDIDEASKAVRSAIEHGITLFDTAEVYGPYHSEILLAKALGSKRKDIVLVSKVGFDYAFELGDGDRGRMLAWLCGTQKRFANDTQPTMSRWWRSRFTKVGTEDWKGRHQVEKDFITVQSALDLAEPIPPLCFEESTTETWPHGEPFILFHPVTRWTQKRWPRERWIELGRTLGGEYPIQVSCGPDAEEIAEAQAIADGIGPQATSTEGKLSWAQLAGALRAAKMFVGVDTAAMHLAAACQCPTVALFGSSRDWAWRPWAVRHQILGPSEADWQAVRDSAQAKQENRKLIFKVSVKDTLAACRAMLER